MQYLQAVPERITRALSTPRGPFFSPFRPCCPSLALPSVGAFDLHLRRRADEANGEIMIKPTSFQWNGGNYRVGCSRLPVFVHYSEAAYKYLGR